MLRDALFLARNDLRHLFRDRPTWLWTFIMPILFFYFLGTVTGGFSHGAVQKDALAFSVPADAGFLAGQLEKRLEERDYRLVRGTPEELAGYNRRLELPSGFTDSVLAGRPVTVTLVRKGSGLGTDYDETRVGRAVYTVLADLIVAARDGHTPTQQTLAAVAAEPHMLTVRVTQAGKRVLPPTGFEQAIPGTMVMFTLLIMFTIGAVTLTIERSQGILRRLAVAPMSRGAIVLGKWGARMGLGLVQLGFAMLAARVLFGLHWGPHLGAIVVLMTAYAALITGLGMVLANFARTEGQVIGIGVVLSNVAAALGGCWWPIEVTPAWAQKLALFLPTGWAMDALHKLVSFGDGPASVVPHILALLTAALAAGFVVARKFRFQ
jgi:ABC-2 type transport system permease protein